MHLWRITWSLPQLGSFLRAQNQRLTSQHGVSHLTLWFQHSRHSGLRTMWTFQKILRAKSCKGPDMMRPPSSVQAASLLRALWDMRGRCSFSSPCALQRKLSFLSISLKGDLAGKFLEQQPHHRELNDQRSLALYMYQDVNKDIDLPFECPAETYCSETLDRRVVCSCVILTQWFNFKARTYISFCK